jgi:hypothetical protein
MLCAPKGDYRERLAIVIMPLIHIIHTKAAHVIPFVLTGFAVCIEKLIPPICLVLQEKARAIKRSLFRRGNVVCRSCHANSEYRDAEDDALAMVTATVMMEEYGCESSPQLYSRVGSIERRVVGLPSAFWIANAGG